MIKKCRSCGLADLAQNVCQMFRMLINPDEDYCSKHQEKEVIKTCDVCGRVIIGHSTIVYGKDESIKLLCDNCYTAVGTCALCENAKYCAFEQDPSQIPIMIQKQVRQGNMSMVTTVKNPARIEITCKKNCKCYSEEKGCLREFNHCGGIVDVF